MSSTSQQVLSILQSYDLKQVKPGEYKCNSPFRPGSNSQAFTVKIEDDEHGAYKDFVSGDAGSLYDLAKKLGIEIPQTTEVANTKRAYSGIADYAIAHGVTPEHLRNAGWQEVQKNGRPALQFVTKTGNRWRFLDGLKPHYISVNDYKKCWYGFNEVTMSRLAYGSDLVITNGEISTVVAHAYGFAAVAVTSGEGAIPADLLAKLKEHMKPYPNNKIVVALDCDDKGRKSTDAIVKQLKSEGLNCHAVDLGLSKGGDFADWLTLYGLDRDAQALLDFRKLPEIVPIDHSPVRRWEIIPAKQMHNLPPIKWLLKPEIPANELTIIYGASGVGKSFVTLDYALRVAQTGNVLYMAGEGESGYSGRIKAWTKYHGLPEDNLFMCLGAVSLLDTADTDMFIYEVSRLVKNPRLIVVDTLARSMLGGDENSSRDMSQFIDRCDMLRRRFNCAVIVVHHTNKAGIWERGSGALRGAAAAMLRISDDDDLIVVESSKTKDSQPFETIYRKLHPVDVGLVDDDGQAIMPMVALVTERSHNIDASGLTRNQRIVLETIADVFDNGFTISELNEALPRFDRGNLYRVVSALKRAGYIQQEAKRDPYTITETGCEVIGANVPNVSNVSNVSVVSSVSANQKNGFEKHEKQPTQPTQPTHSTSRTLFGENPEMTQPTHSRHNYYSEGF